MPASEEPYGAAVVPEELADALALRLGALAHPVRVRAIAQLAHGPATVSDVAAALALPPNGVTKHLRALYRAGVVWRRQEGNFACYGLHDADDLKAIVFALRGLERAPGGVRRPLSAAAAQSAA